MSTARVQLRGIHKRFGSVVALDGAELVARAGEIMGLLGANGAGKSTLLNVLGGLLQPDSGEILLDGAQVALRSPRDAWTHGIASVHQHFALVPALTVAENLALGRGTAETIRTAATEVMQRTGLKVPLDDRIDALSVGVRQRVEILKALLRDPTVLVLDEPTAVLAPTEVDGLFDLLRTLAEAGTAVVLVAHKLDEVMAVADRITVLRGGRTVLADRTDALSSGILVDAMVGSVDRVAGSQPVADDAASTPTESDRPADSAEPVLRVLDVDVVVDGVTRLHEISLDAHPGEIVGIAGIEGNGQRELAQLLAGLLAPSKGTVDLRTSVGFVPQDRSSEGLVGSFDLSENIALALARSDQFVESGRLRWSAIEAEASRLISDFGIVAGSPKSTAASLSGGNQQRLVLARETALPHGLFVAENPTRGLDVAATDFVHRRLRTIAEAGAAVVVSSTDLDEVLALSTRLFVLSRGRLRPAPKGEWSREGVGSLMLGLDSGGRGGDT